MFIYIDICSYYGNKFNIVQKNRNQGVMGQTGIRILTTTGIIWTKKIAFHIGCNGPFSYWLQWAFFILATMGLFHIGYNGPFSYWLQWPFFILAIMGLFHLGYNGIFSYWLQWAFFLLATMGLFTFEIYKGSCINAQETRHLPHMAHTICLPPPSQ